MKKLFCIIFLISLISPAIAEITIYNTSIIHLNDIFAKEPVWSPNGSKIAYIGFGDNNIEQIFIINLDGTGKKQVTHTRVKKWGLKWIKDGITFISYDTDGLEKIYIIQPDGSGLRKIFDDKTRQGMEPGRKSLLLGSVSQNLKNGKILFTSFDKSHNQKIFSININGTDKKQVINDTSRQWSPDWSPDGNSFVYVSYDDNLKQQLFIANSDGSGKKQITFDKIKKMDPNWGIDGILYVSFKDMFSSYEKIYLIKPDGTQNTLVLDDEFRQINPEWSPDYNKILYEQIDSKGNIAFKILNLKKEIKETAKPTVIPTLVSTQVAVKNITATITLTQTPKPIEYEPTKNNLKYYILLAIVFIAIIIISYILIQKRKENW